VLLVLTADGALSGEAAVISQRFFSQMLQPAERAAASPVGDLPVVFEGLTDRSPWDRQYPSPPRSKPPTFILRSRRNAVPRVN